MALLVAILFTFISCEDPSLGQQNARSFGESGQADQALINRLNYSSGSSSNPSPSNFSQWINRQTSGPTGGGFCSSTATYVDRGPDVELQMSAEQRAYLESEVGLAPAPGGPILTELPDAGRGSRDARSFGYSRYRDGDGYVFGTERTIWRIKAAGKLLAAKGMEMGVGDISKHGGGDVDNHDSHEQGRDVDLRLLNSDGKAGPCQVTDRSCFSVQKTFEMVKAFIDVDPSKVNRIYINDLAVRNKINEYYKGLPGNADAADLAKSEPGHHNHVHINWKR